MPGELLGESWALLMVVSGAWVAPEPGWACHRPHRAVCESHGNPAGGSSQTEMRARSEERDVGGKVGSWGLSVLSVQPGLVLGSQQCTHSIGNAHFL